MLCSLRGSLLEHTNSDVSSRLIPLDNDTRWNSWYEMLQVSLEKEIALILILSLIMRTFKATS